MRVPECPIRPTGSTADKADCMLSLFGEFNVSAGAADSSQTLAVRNRQSVK